MAPRDRNNPKRSASSDGTYTLADLRRDFPDDAACLAYLWRENFSPDGEHALCPNCEVERKFHRVKSRPSYSCDVCGKHLHPTAGTIFHKSSTGLDLWFEAIFHVASTRCGMSAKELERQIGVTYKTAWRMTNLIRTQLMQQDDAPLEGDVEADETYVGGKPRLADRVRKPDGSFRKGRLDKAKTTVFGAVERGGRVRAEVIPTGEVGGIPRRVREFVLPHSILFTDEYVGYDRPGREFQAHHRIQHAQRIYVRGDVHTQTIEGFWSTMKNGIRGTYHAVSSKWLQGYLNEYAWRYNHRADEEPMFKSLLTLASRRVDLGAS